MCNELFINIFEWGLGPIPNPQSPIPYEEKYKNKK